MGILFKIAASLLAIYGLYLFARKLGLGGDVRIRDAAHADQLVRESLITFAATDIIIDKAGMSALLRDTDGRMVLVRKHGSHFVASLVPRTAMARLDKNFLTIVMPAGGGSAKITLNLGDKAQYWASAMRHMPHG
jgi:DNA helicase HerA-like ATPase